MPRRRSDVVQPGPDLDLFSLRISVKDIDLSFPAMNCGEWGIQRDSPQDKPANGGPYSDKPDSVENWRRNPKLPEQ